MPDRILIVEDDKHFTAQLRELFEFNGLRVSVAGDGLEGVESFRRFGSDLVLVDVMLPQLHGLQVIEQIRALPSGGDVPILLMSAVYRNESLFKGDLQRLGVHGFLPKPFSILDLGRKVRGILAKPEGGRVEVRGLLDQSPPPPIAPPPPESVAPRDPPTLPPRAASSVRSPAPAPASQPRSPAPGQGTLDHRAYVRLLTHLFTGHTSGVLSLSRGGEALRFYLLNGYPVWAEASQPVSLLDWLISEGVVEARSVEHLRRLGSSREIRGELLRLQILRPDDLPPLMEGWVAWQVGRGIDADADSFKLEETDEFAGKIPVYEVNPIRELWSALQGVPIAVIAADLNPLHGRQLGRTRSFNRLFGYVGSTPTLRQLGEQLLSPRSFDGLLEGFGHDEQVLRCLWLLFSAGLIAYSDAPVTERRMRKITVEDIRTRLASKGSTSTASSAGMAAVSSPRSTPDTRRFGREVVDEVRRRSGGGQHDTPEAQIARDYVTRMELDHYGFLDLEPGASAEDIEAAYQALAPRYRLRNLGSDTHPDTRRQGKELLAKLVEAYTTLSDSSSRARFDRASEAGVAPISDSDAGALDGYPGAASDAALLAREPELGAERVQRWRAARRLIASGDYGRAQAALEALRTESPAEPGILADLAWCSLTLGIPSDQRTQERALEWIGIAVAFDASHPDVMEVQARILTFSSDHEEAERSLQRLSRARPDLRWVRAELRRHRDALKLGSGENNSLFGGLFGRGRGRE